MTPSAAAVLRRDPTRRPRRRMARIGTVVCAVVAVLAIAVTAFADARTDYLVRMLSSAPTFRVRVQAAISLGSVRTEPAVIQALTGALADEHPAVRAAAAAALERHGDPSVLPALRELSRDREAAVRRAVGRAIARLERIERSQPRTRGVPSSGAEPRTEARYYVAVGRPGSRVRGVSRETLSQLRGFIARQAESVSGVQIAPENERAAAAKRVLRERGLVGFYLDSSIVELEERPGGGVRARVSVVVQTYPDRNIRSMLNGSATVTAGSGEAARRAAIEGALRGALRGLGAVMSSGGPPAPTARRRR